MEKNCKFNADFKRLRVKHRVLWPPFSIHMEVIFSQIFHFFAVAHFALACRKYACY